MFRQVDYEVVELRPGIILRTHVHGVVIVQEVEREGKYSPGPLKLEIERGGLSES